MCTAFIFYCCNENDLSLTNPNQLSPETFFKNESQVESSVNAVYANLQTWGLYTRNIFYMMDNMAGENRGNPWLEGDKAEFINFSFDSGNPDIGSYWGSCYRGINKANFVIGNQEAINAIPDGILSPSKKAKFVGEAKFMRGLYYFFLVTRFGDIPLITDIVENGNGTAKSSSEDVYEQIINDFTDASNTLLNKGAEQNGRATKGAAHAMLGKVYLYRQNYSAAMTEFQNVSGYSLEPNFDDNFKEETEHGSEAIFAAEFVDSPASDDIWNSDVSGEGANFSTFRSVEYGFNWLNVMPTDNLLDEFEAGDTRYAHTFYSDGDLYNNGQSTVSVFDGGRASWKKYQTLYKTPNESSAGSGVNMHVIRYADVLLMMAECANQTSQSDAAGFVNQVRSRVGLPSISTTLSQADMFAAIMHERKVELAGEQVRFPDIVRWGNAATELSTTNFQSGKHEVWPIPDSEISSNDLISEADQNPGY